MVPPESQEPEALQLLLDANAAMDVPLPEHLVVEVFDLGEQHAHDATNDFVVASLARAIERAVLES